MGGLVYAWLHYRRGRKPWAEKKWRGEPDGYAARFWRLSARALLIYFVLVNGAGLIALFWPSAPQPLRLRTAISTFALIASNLTAVWLIRLLRDYGRNIQAKRTHEDTIEEVLAQFTTDSGSTMRDAVDRLEVVAAELRRLVVDLGEKADIAAAAAQVIAANLEVAKEKVEAVEADLAESHRRAEDVAHGAQAGEAADAASRMTPAEKQGFEEQEESEK